MTTLAGAASVVANARSSPAYGRSLSFKNEIQKHLNQREPAQHVLEPAHVGHPPGQAKPLHKGPGGPQD